MFDPQVFKVRAGVALYDLPRFLWQIGSSSRIEPRRDWVLIRNRKEKLVSDDRGLGVRCDWKWTSDLHIAKVFPSAGLRLMRKAITDWPIHLEDRAVDSRGEPDLSFIIGHRGKERLPHLLPTIRSIAGQQGVHVECVVVEQAMDSEAQRHLPPWVRYVHAPPSASSMPYCRSKAFNIGAMHARGDLLVLHDNDMLVPSRYSAELLNRFREGFEVINLKRFIFYMSEDESLDFPSGPYAPHSPPLCVVQNLEAGGSVAVSRKAYFEIGGFDEEFVGWGGEDNEFWDRAQSRRLWPFSYLPIVHLWHPPQPGKQVTHNPTLELYRLKSETPVSERIADLRLKMSSFKIQGN